MRLPNKNCKNFFLLFWGIIFLGSPYISAQETLPQLRDSNLEKAKENAAYQDFVQSVRSQIQKKWFVPSSPSGSCKDLRVRVLIKTDVAGKLSFESIQSSSGDKNFDNSVLRAIKSASPFPEAPEAMREQVEQEGFNIEFIKKQDC